MQRRSPATVVQLYAPVPDVPSFWYQATSLLPLSAERTSIVLSPSRSIAYTATGAVAGVVVCTVVRTMSKAETWLSAVYHMMFTVHWLRGDDVIAADAVHLDREHVGDVVRSAVHSLCRKILRAVVAVEDDLVRDLRAHDDVDAAQTIDVRGDDARRPVRAGNTTCTTCNHVLRERGWIRVVHALEPEDAVTGVGGAYDVHV